MNAIFQKRRTLGEFNHLHQELGKDAAKFFDYYRMSQETFLYILKAVEPELTKDSNFRETISPEEQLGVTLR